MTPAPTASRVPAGVPTSGQFATSARAETTLRLTDVDADRGIDALGLPEWSPPSDTSTPSGAFSRCKDTSAEYTAFLNARGIDAEWVQVCGPNGHFPDADARWHSLDQANWQHYLTRVTSPDGTEHYIDWTARQFDPNAEHPHVTPVEADDWAETYPIHARALGPYLDSWHRERATQRPASSLPAGRLRIDDYFDGGVSDYVDTPWLRDGVHITLVPEDWRRMPVAEVPIDGLRRTQPRLIKARVAHHLDSNAEPDGGTVPWVVRWRGEHWVIDGHHRFAAAHLRSERALHAHLLDLDEQQAAA